VRISGFLIPANVAEVIGRHASFNALRVAMRGVDAEAYRSLAEISEYAGKQLQRSRISDVGSERAEVSEVGSESHQTSPLKLSTLAASSALNLTQRQIINLCNSHQLAGEKVDGRWQIDRQSVAVYRSARTRE
jgi:hypothetical protein